jgi:hypothetical protein
MARIGKPIADGDRSIEVRQGSKRTFFVKDFRVVNALVEPKGWLRTRSRESQEYRQEEEGRANKKNVARGFSRSILGATSVARI